ncbi:hypothetical protein KR093_009317 [Drosophila rubida]|uniref:CHK kinase-like domain-containing protein n=1 Tax=Drosophila rubida TaxID=30044 RepID=A0AAD4JV67_9MUSC|nr:hypothetical protein KR093_009317 [Drosophila rubida]
MAPNSATPENPNEFLDIPKWINEDYFRPILEKDVNDFAGIKKFTCIAATQPGDNYTSIMVRVIIDIETKDGSEKNISYILKTVLDTDKGGDLVAGMSLFPKEKEMYQVHISNFIRLYKEAGVDIKLAPKCVHIDETPEGITLVMEDLKQQKFANVDRFKGFDMEHMTMVLRKVAELHAASVVTHEQNGPYDDKYYQSFYNESNRKVFEGMLEIQGVQHKKAMLKWNLPDVEKYINKVVSPKDFFDKGLALNNVDESEFNVLNHGDLWSNNIMFCGDQTLFVDLQVSKWGSPAQDLWYLIISSCSLDIKVKEFDHFIQIYHNRLVECLKLLKYTKHIPTLKQLHIMMIKHGDWAMATANGVLTVVLLPAEKDANIHSMMAPGPEGDAFRLRIFSNPLYEKAMVQLLPFLKNKGLL